MTRLLVRRLLGGLGACGIAMACGGETFTTDDGSDGSGGSDDGSTDGGSTGGAPGSGGQGTGGAIALYGSGSVRFLLTTQKAQSACLEGCGGASPTILTDNGSLRTTTGCVTSCDVCQPIACAAAPCLANLYFTNTEFTFDGTTYREATCGEGFSCDASEKLYISEYQADGLYTAEFCTAVANPYTDGTCSSTGERHCVKVDFEWKVGTDSTIEVDMTPP